MIFGIKFTMENEQKFLSKLSLNPSNRSSIASTLKSEFTQPRSSSKTGKSQRVSYALTKAIVQTGSADEYTTSAEIEEEFSIDGDINIVSRFEGTHEILCLSYTETKDHIAAGLADGTIRLINVKTGELISTLQDSEIIKNPGAITAIKHRPLQKSHAISQTITATYEIGCLKSWHYPTGRCLYTVHEDRETLGLSYHPNLPKFATVGDDGNTFLYDEETKTQERILHACSSPNSTNSNESRVYAVAFNPRSLHELITGGWDDEIRFWDTRQPHATKSIKGVHICGDSLDINNSGKEVLSCAWAKKNAIQMWDYGSGRLIVTLEPDSWDSHLYSGKFVEGCFVACGGCNFNLFRIIDLRSHTTIASIRQLPGGVRSLDIGQLYQSGSHKILQLPKIAFCCGKSLFEVVATP